MRADAKLVRDREQAVGVALGCEVVKCAGSEAVSMRRENLQAARVQGLRLREVRPGLRLGEQGRSEKQQCHQQRVAHGGSINPYPTPDSRPDSILLLSRPIARQTLPRRQPGVQTPGLRGVRVRARHKGPAIAGRADNHRRRTPAKSVRPHSPGPAQSRRRLPKLCPTPSLRHRKTMARPFPRLITWTTPTTARPGRRIAATHTEARPNQAK